MYDVSVHDQESRVKSRESRVWIPKNGSPLFALNSLIFTLYCLFFATTKIVQIFSISVHKNLVRQN